MSKIIGIDLGSTLSEVAVVEGGKPTIIVNEEGSRTTPSVIAFLEGGERKVGASAKRQMVTNPKNTINLIKRFMGGTYDEVKDNISHIQYDVINKNGYPRILVGGKEYSPEELSAMILGKLKKCAEDYLGETVTDAVITVPAFFNNDQREATKRAGEIAGLNVRRIVAEPTAAIMASEIDINTGGKYMVVDYGGSTLDFSIADISDGVVEILASNGDVYCGGSDLDKLVTKYITDEYKKTEGIDLTNDAMAMSRIVEAAEQAKVELSNVSTTNINLPYITATESGPKHLNIQLTRAKFEQIIDGEITKVINLGKEAIKKAGIKTEDLNGILLVGGSTRIPKVQDELTKAFNRPLLKNVNVDEVVALGAAVQGSILAGENKDILLLDVIPLSLGIETMGGVFTKLVEANTTIPVSKTEVFTTAVDNQPSVEIKVLQGERPMAKDNKQLGIFHLDGIVPARKGVPQIEVKFDIDANGILSVSATDKGTGKAQSIRIEGSSGLSDAEIERMRKEAEANAEADKKELERVQTLNAAEATIFRTEKQIEEYGDKITDEQKSELENGLTALKDAYEQKDVDACKSCMEILAQSWYKISEELYKNTGGTSDNPGGGNPMDDIINNMNNGQ